MPFAIAFTGLGTLFLVSSFYFFDRKKDFSFATIFSELICLFVLVMLVIQYQGEMIQMNH